MIVQQQEQQKSQVNQIVYYIFLLYSYVNCCVLHFLWHCSIIFECCLFDGKYTSLCVVASMVTLVLDFTMVDVICFLIQFYQPYCGLLQEFYFQICSHLNIFFYHSSIEISVQIFKATTTTKKRMFSHFNCCFFQLTINISE